MATLASMPSKCSITCSISIWQFTHKIFKSPNLTALLGKIKSTKLFSKHRQYYKDAQSKIFIYSLKEVLIRMEHDELDFLITIQK